MGKQWARQQVRRDEIKSVLDKTMDWAAANRGLVLKGGGTLLAALLLGAGAFLHRRHMQGQAWERLSLAQALAYSGRPDQALEEIEALADELPTSDAAGFGLVFAGDVNYQRGRHAEALELYSRVIDAGRPRAALPLALGNAAIALEASGKAQEAARRAQSFLETYPDHFFAPQVHASLSRALLASGQREQAKAAWQKIVLQYPDTYWASWAQARLSGS